jgi:hypothetical protein
MISVRRVTVLVFLVVLSASSIHAQDLSSYRDFQFGMNLSAVAKQAGMNLAAAKMLHQRPAMIQELWWQRSFGESSPQTDPVREVVFSFYNGGLFRMVVSYDRYRTEGFTDDDMIEAVSAKYGLAARPVATIVLFSSSQIYNESEKVIALWEDSQYSYNLYRSSNQPTFGMVIFSKRLDTLAQAAIVEAMRLDNQEAPQIEKERQEMEDAVDPWPQLRRPGSRINELSPLKIAKGIRGLSSLLDELLVCPPDSVRVACFMVELVGSSRLGNVDNRRKTTCSIRFG